MRRVPHYLIIGNGRVSKHFQHYFTLSKISYSTWQRSQSEQELDHLLNLATHSLILTSDHAIEAIATICQSKPTTNIHFSGSLVAANAYGAHPLMGFAHDLYSLESYQQIPFIVDADAPEFTELLPGLNNPHVRLEKSLKAKYHALCVMSGNFTCLLWQKLFYEFETTLKIPGKLAHPYMQQQIQNLLTRPDTALTGPLVRGDQQTITNNLHALVDDPFQKVYESFVNAYNALNPRIQNENI